MEFFNSIVASFDIFDGKYDFLIDLHRSNNASEDHLIDANNQLLTNLINSHAKSDLISQYVSMNSQLFEQNMSRLFGDLELIKEVIKVGSNLSDYFGYCGFSSDSTKISDGFSLVIDKNCLAFSHNDVHSLSDLISKNIRFRKAINKATNFDPSYQLPTYSVYGVNFHIVPVEEIKYPYIEI
ncbi:hypothetical protein [Colwellia sp. MEBiC06753]